MTVTLQKPAIPSAEIEKIFRIEDVGVRLDQVCARHEAIFDLKSWLHSRFEKWSELSRRIWQHVVVVLYEVGALHGEEWWENDGFGLDATTIFVYFFNTRWFIFALEIRR